MLGSPLTIFVSYLIGGMIAVWPARVYVPLTYVNVNDGRCGGLMIWLVWPLQLELQPGVASVISLARIEYGSCSSSQTGLEMVSPRSIGT